jgi:hypothetical protein
VAGFGFPVRGWSATLKDLAGIETFAIEETSRRRRERQKADQDVGAGEEIAQGGVSREGLDPAAAATSSRLTSSPRSTAAGSAVRSSTSSRRSRHLPIIRSSRRRRERQKADQDVGAGEEIAQGGVSREGLDPGQADLLAALDGGRLGGAILDVLAAEPAPADHPLLSHPNRR